MKRDITRDLEPPRGGSATTRHGRMSSTLEFLDGMSSRFFSAHMKRHIVRNTCVRSSIFGEGLFARRDLEKGTVVGYYTGPVLTWNNIYKYEGEEDYVAAGSFVHPISKKKMSYHILVVGPTRYMNHGHQPRYYRSTLPCHDMIANTVMLSEKMFKIGERYRPVLVFKTTRRVKRHTELLYDYGVHEDEIYYEVLRRQNALDTKAERQRFRSVIGSIERAKYKNWKARLHKQPWGDWDTRNAFFQELLVEFLNAPDTILYPTKAMV